MGFDAYVSGGFPGAGPSILIKENAAIFGHFQSYSMNHVRLSWDIEIFVDGNHCTSPIGQPPDTVVIGLARRFSADSSCSSSFGFDENNSFS